MGLSIGALLALAGAWMLRGGKLYSGLAQRAAAGIGNPNQVGVRGYFLFGVAYATASLSCTLPIFLAVTGISLASGNSIAAVGQFLVYALGMGSVIMLLTLALALFKGVMVKGMRQVIPYLQPVGAGFMVLAGAYIVFYWLTAGGLLNKPL
jgi:cytochrome c biogenesis protein CcdA